MKIRLGNGISGKKEVEVSEGTTIGHVITANNLNNQTIISLLNGQLAHPSTQLREGDELELVGVIYGG